MGDQLLASLIIERATGCELVVQVVPRADRNEVAGLHGGAVRIRLNAPPVDGRANEALLRWITESLGIPRRAAEIAGGATSRRKRVRLACEAARVRAWLQSQLGTAS